MRQNGVRSNVRFPYSSGMKKGGSAKKQGYYDKEDESIGMRSVSYTHLTLPTILLV